MIQPETRERRNKRVQMGKGLLQVEEFHFRKRKADNRMVERKTEG